MELVLEFRVDDLSGNASQALVRRHLEGMHQNSPPESVHALSIDQLRQPGVTLWSGWINNELVVIGALKRLDAENGEIKSMRVEEAWLGKGIGWMMLNHITQAAKRAGMKVLWLETGSADAFIPALELYASAGFVRCAPFGDYTDDPFSVFMMKAL
ncbi:MAG: GNAT family N-acetyltransferase [Hyphomonadaceae bacterium]